MDVKKYLPQKTPIGFAMKESAEGYYVTVEDFDRVTAERDALQQLLNVLDEENCELRSLLHSLDCAWNSHDGRERFGSLMKKVESLASIQNKESQA